MNFTIRKLSVSQQILSVALALSVVLAGVVLSFSARQIVDNKNAIKETINKDRSFGAVEKIDRNFYERFGDVQAFAVNQLAREAIDSGRATPNVQKFINTMVAYYVLYDLMMIVDENGSVIATNTKDKKGSPLDAGFLIGENFAGEEWFRQCSSREGPEGGAWYSDFIEVPFVGRIYRSEGRGVAFAAPIKNDQGRTVGVWYNVASWKDVTQGIRSETEALLQKTEPESFELITDRNGKVIDSGDERLISTLTITEEQLTQKDLSFDFHGRTIAARDYIFGFGQARGAYTYKGNGWIGVTVAPKISYSPVILFGELLPFTTIILVILVAGVIFFLRLANRISGKLGNLKTVVDALNEGELVDIASSTSHDEIGQMTNAVRALVAGLKKTSAFASEIGTGNLDASFEALSKKDTLGHSLLTMRDNLRTIRNEEYKRNWVTKGLAEFSDKLRNNAHREVADLCDGILVFLCRYLNANQAALFLEMQDTNTTCLQLVACYAWDRKKYFSKKIAKGEGIIGQAWQEGNLVLLTEVPDDFIRITSGLGHSNPDTIIILPLTSEEQVLGILEVASFRKFESHEIEFLKKISENLGSTLAAAKTNERTKKLLEQTQQQAETLRSQEEEMRQNLEEMQSTQEEFQRREKDYQHALERLSKNGHVASTIHGKH